MSDHPKNQHLRHIVFFKVHQNTNETQIQEAIQLLRRLGADQKGILEWTITESLDTRKGRIIIENGLFADPTAFEEFRRSPKHQRTAEFMSDISDWLVGDYDETHP